MFAKSSTFCIVTFSLFFLVNASFNPLVIDHRKVPTLAAKFARTTKTCVLGQWNNQGSCTTCQSGHYCDGTNQYMCQQGTYAASGASSCTICPAGSYCNGQGATQPTKCQAGQYAPHTGYGGSCDACPAGYWNNAQGSTSCCPCCAGSFNAGTSQTHCQACPNGQTSVSGSISCHTGSGPTAPSWCTNGIQSAANVCPAAASGARKRTPKAYCPIQGTKDCPILSGRGGRECVDVMSDLESCGGCMDVSPLAGGGVDCTQIRGAMDVACTVGRCVVSRCEVGYILAADRASCLKIPVLVQADSFLRGF